MRVKAQRLADLAFGHEAELLERQSAQRDATPLQQPGLELALNLELQLARLVLDPRLYRHPINVDVRVGGTRAGNDPKHDKNMVPGCKGNE
jgi:hypothetical protein